MKVVGQVQGVWYRASTAGVAQNLKLKGYAKNLSDGSVEIVAVGDEAGLLKLKKWCERGPKHSVVGKIEEEWNGNEQKFAEFLVL